jgi:cytochrome c biogenesis protein CcdA
VILVLAFVAGLLTILSPCVLPLAPIVIAGARAEDPRGPIALAAGLATSFALVGGALAVAGVELGSSPVARAAVAVLMLAAGLALVVPAFANALEYRMAGVATWAERRSGDLPGGLIGQFALGALLAVAWAPCVGPTLGAALSLAASGGSPLIAGASMAVYALGVAMALIGAGFVLGRLAAGGRRALGVGAGAGRTAFGFVLALVGAAILTGADKRLEEILTTAMPDWLVTLATRL